MEILSYWRTSHASALEAAFDLLEEITNKIDKYAVLAKRLKRTPSIINKLKRFNSKGMQLSTMQDIGGCRIILSNLKNVYKLIKILKKQKLFELRNDYIATPKDDGYKSIHLIGKFKNSDGEFRSIELQIRTKVQHSWATAVEIVDLFTNQSLKSNSGKTIWKDFFKHTSNQFTVLENNSYLNSSKDRFIFKGYLENFRKLNNSNLRYSSYKVYDSCKKLNIINNFQLFTNSLKITSEQLKNNTTNGYILIIVEIIEGNTYGISSVYYNEDEVVKANNDYLLEEKKSFKSNNIVALVSTNAIGGVKEAYPNYFADSNDFIKYLQITNLAYEKLNPSFFKILNNLLYKFKK
ncbi:RelA/SpoT domain-containing protein [Aliarcobacter butzleri]|uniref:RelA/SpoT domain-containing protein n=1 Tax=Aliarcobacter butzleri TaxID=28197 RepID=UPI00186986C9|nr:RelA/SpoT domain-containing protein [Aliarcobacter butzleri]